MKRTRMKDRSVYTYDLALLNLKWNCHITIVVHIEKEPESQQWMYNSGAFKVLQSTVRIWVIEIGKKVWRGFEYIFHTYFMRGLQKYQGKWNPTMAFRGQN